MKIRNYAMLIPLLLAYGCTAPDPNYREPVQQEEQEDCDADDLLEGDEDCYGVDLSSNHRRKHKVKPVRRVAQPVTSPVAQSRNVRDLTVQAAPSRQVRPKVRPTRERGTLERKRPTKRKKK